MTHDLFSGFSQLLTPEAIGLLFVGMAVGMFMGMLPGMGVSLAPPTTRPRSPPSC
jgi:TctA family transporter